VRKIPPEKSFSASDVSFIIQSSSGELLDWLKSEFDRNRKIWISAEDVYTQVAAYATLQFTRRAADRVCSIYKLTTPPWARE
jgi:hypothetical protein